MKLIKTMNALGRNFATVFGTCVITAILCSGCATDVVSLRELNDFSPDCRLKTQHLAYLQYLRAQHNGNARYIHDQYNWTINAHINYLAHQC